MTANLFGPSKRVRVDEAGRANLGQCFVDHFGAERLMMLPDSLPAAYSLFRAYPPHVFERMTRSGIPPGWEAAIEVDFTGGVLVLPGLAGRWIHAGTMVEFLTIRTDDSSPLRDPEKPTGLGRLARSIQELLPKHAPTAFRATRVDRLERGGRLVGFAMGTFHLGAALPPRIWAVLAQCTAVALELIAEDQACALRHYTPSEHMQARMRETLEVLRDAGMAQHSMEKELERLADERGLPVFSLETPASQLALMWELDRTAAAVPYAAEVARTRLAQARELFVKGDWDGVLALARPETIEVLATPARHRRMLDRLLPLLEEHVVLIAVGAAHLPGEKGLLALLADHGIEITGGTRVRR